MTIFALTLMIIVCHLLSFMCNRNEWHFCEKNIVVRARLEVGGSWVRFWVTDEKGGKRCGLNFR